MRTYFTEEQQAELYNNLYTYKTTKSCLKFTDDFKNTFWKMYIDEIPIKEIFTRLGYDPELLGTKRIEGFVYHLRKEKLSDEQRSQSVNRTTRVKRPPQDTKYSEMQSQDAIRAMEADIYQLPLEIYLNKLNSNKTTWRNNSSIRVYRFTVYNSSGVKRIDLIPAVVSGTACMYDTVSGKYFYNSGAGSFIHSSQE